MAGSRLEVISSKGDQTWSTIRFGLHGVARSSKVEAMLQSGLGFAEGRPAFSTSIVHAQDWTVMIWGLPAYFHLGYGAFTSAYIERSLKRVVGAPLRYAAGREQLALYLSPDTESARVRIEAEVGQGFTLEQRPQFILDPKFVLGSFSGVAFEQLARKIDVSVRSFEGIDYMQTERALRELFAPQAADWGGLAPTMMKDILNRTVEAIVMSELRMMRWQGLALLGYTFMEDGQMVQLAPMRDIAQQRAHMEGVGRKLVSSSGLFTAELAWLKTYAAHMLELMKIELAGLEL